MEKRVFTAIFLSFLVLAGYQYFFAPPPVPSPSTVAPAADPAVAGQTATTGTGPATAADAAAAQPAASTAVALVADAAARDIVVDTDSVRAVFSTAGATLKSWKLKHHLDTTGEPLELIPQDLPDTFPRPFTISTNDPAISRTVATALYRPSAESLTLGSSPGQLSFEYKDESGLSARKTFFFQPETQPVPDKAPVRQDYVLKVEAAIDQGGTSRPVTLNSGLGVGLGYQPDGSTGTPARGVHHLNGKVHHLSDSSLKEQPKYDGDIRFAGAEDLYFLNAVLPGTEKVSIEYQPATLPVPGKPDTTRTLVSYSVSVPGSLSLPFFLGPKDFDVLRNVDPRLELVRAIDFGMFAAIVVPLLQALKWVNGFVGNYGWAIVVLTVIINLIIFPLRHKSMVSMKKMQAVQPEVKAIQERYAKYKITDPERQKMNQEMMALYKQRGVNPVSGCVPMLLTMPILLAFYAMLSQSIEMRGAPFVGWITDLSRHDPYYITPVLMGLSMLVQQKMMPTTADPIQQKMFLLMPVIFTVSFLWAPAGLVVYWFVSNLLTIGQQFLTNRMIGTPAPVRVAAPKRVRSGNSGAAKS